MTCRRCKTENPDASRFCSACGALLTRPPAKTWRAFPRPWLAGAGAVVLLLLCAYLLVPGFRSRSSEPAATDAAPAASESPEAIPPSGPFALTACRIVLDRTARGAPAAIETVLFDGSWAALPLWAFIRADAPRLESPGPSGIAPAAAAWTAPEPLVLCRFELGESPETPVLAPYDGSAVLEWRPLSGERTSLAIEPGPLSSAGSFKAFTLFKTIEAPGVLLQEGRLVGWTFGHGVERGYLWAPAGGGAPKASLTPTELCATLRAGSREASFILAFSTAEGATDDLRLEAFATGFSRPALLSPGDLPTALKPAAVAVLMSSLTSSLVRQGKSDEASRILDRDVLAAAADVLLVKSAAGAYLEAHGFEAVHRLLLDLRRDPAIQTAPAFKEMDAVEVDLAKSALHKILNERGYGGLEIFEAVSRLAPDDLELRLLGVEVAVLEKQWVRAEELLGDLGAYPTDRADKARTLERLVEEGRRDEDSVTIRFNPGDKLIPVYAYLNKTHRQKFFIDTGATTTVIPTTAVAALGIRIDNTTPVVGFQGVTGGDLAYQVGVDSIEIERLAVHDIRAIVYDLGEDENAGLLGNDFLQYFQVDLDSVKGILKLRKR